MILRSPALTLSAFPTASQCAPRPSVVLAPGPQRSLQREAWDEANRHKWIESEKHGRDLGSAALDQWYHEHFATFCRLRRLQHVRGAANYLEFGAEACGRLRAILEVPDSLVDAVLDRLEDGWENLSMIKWALDWGLPMERIIELLELVDINGARLEPQRSVSA